jgi:hypothetical protein
MSIVEEFKAETMYEPAPNSVGKAIEAALMAPA